MGTGDERDQPPPGSAELSGPGYALALDEAEVACFRFLADRARGGRSGPVAAGRHHEEGPTSRTSAAGPGALLPALAEAVAAAVGRPA